jgi:hypothetical protein
MFRDIAQPIFRIDIVIAGTVDVGFAGHVS